MYEVSVTEKRFVDELIRSVKIRQPCVAKARKFLFYRIPIDNELQIKANPGLPKRDGTGFQTDFCVYEKKANDIEIPRIVIEFKIKPSTHGFIISSSNARRHKSIYPYLRYGLISIDEPCIAEKFCNHHDGGLDFYLTLGTCQDKQSKFDLIEKLIEQELKVSETLESIYYGNNARYILYQTKIMEISTPSNKR